MPSTNVSVAVYLASTIDKSRTGAVSSNSRVSDRRSSAKLRMVNTGTSRIDSTYI